MCANISKIALFYMFILISFDAMSQQYTDQHSSGTCNPNVVAGGNVNINCTSSQPTVPQRELGMWCRTPAGIAGPGLSNPVGSPCNADGVPGVVVNPMLGNYCQTYLGRGNAGYDLPVGSICFSDGPYGQIEGRIVR